MYHFFSVHAPPIIADNIHTHPHSFTSNVIKGGIRNHIYRIDDAERETNYCVRRLRFRADPATPVETVRDNVSYEKTVTFDTYAGNEYDIHNTTMHKIELLEPKTITLIECSPHIGALIDVYFVMDKNTSYTKEQLHNRMNKVKCWEIVADTLA
jgi:hypothetical protein